MIHLTTVQYDFLPRLRVIITIYCRKLHAIVNVQPVSSCAVVSTHLKSVVVAFIFDVKITKINTKCFLLSSCNKVSQSVCVCVCVVLLQQLFSLMSWDGWLNFSTNIRLLSAVYILNVTVCTLNPVILS